MNADAAQIRDLERGFPAQLALHTEGPLREVGPIGLGSPSPEAPVPQQFERRADRELRIAGKQVSRACADEDRLMAVVPYVIDVDDRVVLVEVGWLGFPAEAGVNGEFSR